MACAVLAEEVKYLRQRLAEKDEQLLAVTHPTALAQVRRDPLPGAGLGGLEVQVGPDGPFVNIAGRAVPLGDLQALLGNANIVTGSGEQVSPEMARQAEQALDRMFTGRH